MKSNNNNDNNTDILVGRLSELTNDIEKKDNNKIIGTIKNIGREIYDIAKRIGCNILATIIKDNVGI